MGHRRGWLEQFVLWLFRLSVEAEEPEREADVHKKLYLDATLYPLKPGLSQNIHLVHYIFVCLAVTDDSEYIQGE